jgi:mono/diheme cytochrome c family protein
MPLLKGACFAFALAAASLFHATPAQAAGTPVDFNRDITPILANNCFKCHGPDGKERKGGTKELKLRLDRQEGAYANYHGVIPIVPGQPDKSELVTRISSTDPNEIMPPANSGKKLTARQIELLKAWVAQGGRYARHWSYVKPVRPALPEVKNKSWARNGIDAFILARLEKEGLSPQPEADRYTLIRRLALDITGLPPTVEEVDEFVKDTRPDAYEQLVDRLLAKPAYGEQWSRMWLDLARYADSDGYASDTPRTIWAYRDYVINSFNQNKPFDQFTIEQIAGDLLPNPTQEQIVATAFHRNTMTNTEGGTTREEFRNAAIVDRVNTTMAVWMGTSMACCQCHDHKYDPLPQKDYFRLFAILNNTEDADRPDEEPTAKFYTPSQSEQRSKLQGEIAALEKTLKTPSAALLAGQERWEKAFPLDVQWQSPGADVKAQETASPASRNGTASDTYTIEVPLTDSQLAAIRLVTVSDEKTARKGKKGAGKDHVVTRVRVSIVPEAPAASSDLPRPKVPSKITQLALVEVYADEETSGYELAAVLRDPAPKPKKAVAKDKKKMDKPGWLVSAAGGKPHFLTLLPRVPANIPEGSKLVISIEQSSPAHFRALVTSDARAGELARAPLDVVKALAVKADGRTAAQSSTVTQYYLANVAPELKTERAQLPRLKQQLDDMKQVTVPVMRELAGNARKTFIQFRGNYLSLGDEVTPGVPETLGALPAGMKADRLGLARWLVDDNNPLTARVIANRYWEQIFGIGIVRTSEEFGSQGEQPTHPELLDWLATEMVRGKWDRKRFVKLLVTSATYRQSSRVSPELVQRDPDNRLLARGPRFRMSAEMVRDQALALSGLLSHKMFGPSVRPPRPSAGLTAAFGGGLDWEPSPGEDRYRRGIYTEARRTSPYPSTSTFDAPSREICTLRRVRTNTPLQALVTLNDPVYIEAAQALARKMAAAGSTPKEKVVAGFRACMARPPHEVEINRLIELYDEAHESFAQDAKKAADMATNPIGPLPKGADAVDLAAWTTVANVMMNLDEVVMRR